MEKFNDLKIPPYKLAMPDVPEPTSFALTKNYYINANKIAKTILTMLNKKSGFLKELTDQKTPHDVPGSWFKGPF